MGKQDPGGRAAGGFLKELFERDGCVNESGPWQDSIWVPQPVAGCLLQQSLRPSSPTRAIHSSCKIAAYVGAVGTPQILDYKYNVRRNEAWVLRSWFRLSSVFNVGCALPGDMGR